MWTRTTTVAPQNRREPSAHVIAGGKDRGQWDRPTFTVNNLAFIFACHRPRECKRGVPSVSVFVVRILQYPYFRTEYPLISHLNEVGHRTADFQYGAQYTFNCYQPGWCCASSNHRRYFKLLLSAPYSSVYASAERQLQIFDVSLFHNLAKNSMCTFNPRQIPVPFGLKVA